MMVSHWITHTRCLRALTGQVLRNSKGGGGGTSLDNLSHSLSCDTCGVAEFCPVMTSPLLWHGHTPKSLPTSKDLWTHERLWWLSLCCSVGSCTLNTSPGFLLAPAIFAPCIFAVLWDELSAALKHSRMAAATSLDRRRALPHGHFSDSLSKPSHTCN